MLLGISLCFLGVLTSIPSWMKLITRDCMGSEFLIILVTFTSFTKTIQSVILKDRSRLEFPGLNAMLPAANEAKVRGKFRII